MSYTEQMAGQPRPIPKSVRAVAATSRKLRRGSLFLYQRRHQTERLRHAAEQRSL
jgi:hypothetical protein